MSHCLPRRSKAHTRHRICAGLSATQSVYIHLLFRLVLEQASKTSQLPELDGSGASDGASDASDDVRLNSLSMTKPTTVIAMVSTTAIKFIHCLIFHR